MATNASLGAALLQKPPPPGTTPWWTDADAQGVTTTGEGSPGGTVNLPSAVRGTDPAYLAALAQLGWTAPINQQTSGGTDGDVGGSNYQPFLDWLNQNGYTSKTSYLDQKGTGDQISALFDQGGNELQGTQRQYGSDVNSDAFLGAMLAGGAFGGAAAAGLGASAGGAGGLSSSDAAALYGDAGYGSAGGAGGAGGVGGAGGAGAGANAVNFATDPTWLGTSETLEGGATPAGALSNSSPGLAGLSGTQTAEAGSGLGSAGSSLGSGTDAASTGSDAHLYNSAGDLGNMGGAGSTTIPTVNTGGSGGLVNSLQGLLQNSDGSGLSSIGKGLVGLGAGALTGSLGGGDTGMLNSVDYQKAATAQGQSARTDQVNSQGQLQYKQTGTDAQGNPTYTQVSTLNAPYQANLNSALGNQSTALGNLSSYNQGLPAAYAGVPGLYGDSGSQAGLVKQAQDAAYNQQTSYLDPQYAQLQKQLQAQLANQGVSYGSDAYNAANTQFGSQQNQAYGTARDSAIAQGDTYANTLFNQNLAAHQQGMADINNQGNNYLGQSNGALTGVVQNPTFAATPAATNYLGAAQLQGNANLNQYNAKIGNTNNLTSGLTGLAGAALGNSNFWSGLSGLFGGGG